MKWSLPLKKFTSQTHLEDEAHSPQRRKLLKAAAFAGITVAPGVLLYQIGHAKTRPVDEPVSDKVRWGMLVDANACADGCTACVSACDKENGLHKHGNPTTDVQWIRKLTISDPQTGYSNSFPVMCQHCEKPPCVDVCPTGASFRREDGIVLVDKHICIGCRYCMMACPYKARSFIHEDVTDPVPHNPRGKGTVESCTLCVHKVDRGDGTTACVEACAKEGHHALMFGDLNDPNSEISQRLSQYSSTQIRADLKLNTGVRYTGI